MKKYKSLIKIMPETQKYMDEVVRQLEEKEQLDSTDTLTLQTLAFTHTMYIQAAKKVVEDGAYYTTSRGAQYTTPQVEVMFKAQSKLETIINSLGLSPLARKRIQGAAQQEEDKSPLAEYLKEFR